MRGFIYHSLGYILSVLRRIWLIMILANEVLRANLVLGAASHLNPRMTFFSGLWALRRRVAVLRVFSLHAVWMVRLWCCTLGSCWYPLASSPTRARVSVIATVRRWFWSSGCQKSRFCFPLRFHPVLSSEGESESRSSLRLSELLFQQVAGSATGSCCFSVCSSFSQLVLGIRHLGRIMLVKKVEGSPSADPD